MLRDNGILDYDYYVFKLQSIALIQLHNHLFYNLHYVK